MTDTTLLNPTGFAVDNFTAILPVTCNASCGFCPEKEMSDKLPWALWINGLVDAVNTTHARYGYDHISLSGGEPSLDSNRLQETLNALLNRTPIKKIEIGRAHV